MTNIDQIIKNAPKKAKPRRMDFQVERIYGEEPKWEGITNEQPDFNRLVTNALNWCNASLTHEEYKEETINYLISKSSPVGKLNDLPDWKFVNTGKVAWLLNNNCPLTENWIIRFKLNIENMLKDSGSIEENGVIISEEGEVTVVEAKPRLFEKRNRTQAKKVSEHFMNIEGLVDSAVLGEKEINESEVYKEFTDKKVDEKTARQVFDRLNTLSKVLLDEVDAVEALSDEEKIAQFDDAETLDEYTEEVREAANQYIEVINQIGAYLGNKRALKKSERKMGSKFKEKRIEQQVSKVNFKLQDTAYKIASINPIAIVGSQTLITFNTESRKLFVYKAATEEGLSIKGTTIQNFDEATSFKKIIKKPEMLKQLQEGNIRRVEVLLDGIRAKSTTVNGRVNEHTILLKAYKETYGKK